MKHEHCGGELRKRPYAKGGGHYRCDRCGEKVEIGHHVSYGARRGYIRRQQNREGK